MTLLHLTSLTLYALAMLWIGVSVWAWWLAMSGPRYFRGYRLKIAATFALVGGLFLWLARL